MIAHEHQPRDVEDRRKVLISSEFPFFDTEGTLVRYDRRVIPERRDANLTTSESSAIDIKISEINSKRLFIWLKDEIHEVQRRDEGVWVGRASDCFATFSSRFISRKHLHLYFDDGTYYLTDNSANGTYIKNDDGEMFVTKDKITVKGNGIISLGVPFDHSESNVIHYFIG